MAVDSSAALQLRLASDVHPDLEGFLRRTLADDIQLVAISTTEGRFTRAAYFGSDVTAAVAWARDMNSRDQRCGVYYAVNRVRPGLAKKAKKTELVGARMAHVDIDPPSDCADWSYREAVARLQGAPLAPTTITVSGNGVHGLWRVTPETSLAEVEEINERLLHHFAGDPGTHNFDRILRLPGTVNWPTAKKAADGRRPMWAEIESADCGKCYSAADLLAAFPPVRDIGSGTAITSDDFMTGYEPRLGLTLDEIADLLSAIDSGCPREPWFLAVCAVHHETGGSDEGFDLVNDWSSTAHNYAGEDDLRYQWDRLREDGSGQRRVTMRSVIDMAKKAGWNGSLHAPSGGEPGPPPSECAADTASDCLPAPFAGFMAEAVTLALKTAKRPQPELTKVAVVLGMAGSIGGGVHLPDGTRLNLYGLAIAPTGAGKDHLIGVATAIADKGGADLLGDIATLAGLEDNLRSTTPMLSVQDEIAHFFASREDKGSSFWRGVEKGLLDLFSAGKRPYTTRLIASQTRKVVQNPTLNLLGFATPIKLGEALSDGDAASGLLGRMLVAMGDGNVPLQSARHAFELSPDMAATLDTVKMTRLGFEVRMSAEVFDEGERLMRLLDAEAQQQPDGSPERSLLMRTYEKAIRLAGVIAVFSWAETDIIGRSDTPAISMEHLRWAIDFAKASDQTMLRFLHKHMHGGKVQANAAKLMVYAEAALKGSIAPGEGRPSQEAALREGFVPVSILQNRSRLDRRAVNEAVDHLVSGDVLRRTTFAYDPVVGKASRIDVVYFPDEG